LAALAYQMPAKNIVSDHNIKILPVWAAERHSGNGAGGRLGLLGTLGALAGFQLLVEINVGVVTAALAAANVGEGVHAMHDPTEGGLAAGLFELVAPVDLGLRVTREHIPVFPETEAICSALALDPLKLTASGALLIAVAPYKADSVLTEIESTGVPVAVLGEVRPSSEGITIVTNGP